ncbi:hypothetical protein QAD02_010968 [Eretmocerus hayati]|uniref:Uncharacterized protein n=1 Tax=Eretmocerus hayati TaxID=131215 RepID=A0ACC2NVR2_9HYME|nr:hypothetical protein QAD02_010968 [Eretmocerus hayati]
MDEYETEIQLLRRYASENNISENEINEVFEDCFNVLEVKTNARIRAVFKSVKWVSLILFSLTLVTFVLYNHPQIHNFLLRNVQDLIYPGLRILRKLAVPIITLLPFLTEWYDEWCLVENPYFYVDGMDCWPCTNVNSVQNLTDLSISPTFNTGIPFIREEKQDTLDIKKFHEFYEKHKRVSTSDAQQFVLNQIFHSPVEVGYEKPSHSREDVHIKWRINRMETGRELRRIFSGPAQVPDWWSPSTEKFVFIDQPKVTAYSMPNPECANVIIQCKTGERLIELNPSPGCSQNCRKLSITLKARQSLWYNWWYWRPTSLPIDNTTGITITYLTSYC